MPRTIRRYAGRGGGPNDLRARAATDALCLYWTTDTHTWAMVDEDPGHPQAVDSTGRKLFYQVPTKLRKMLAAINTDRPHAVIHTGDLIERDDLVYPWAGTGTEFAYFRSEFWDQIDPGIERIYTLGNHDYAIEPDAGLSRQETAAARMGETTLTGGGYFNRAVTLTGNGVTVRFLVIDTNEEYEADPAYYNGSLTDAQKAWLAGEFADPAADIIVTVSHHGPHDSRGGNDAWPNAEDRDWLRATVATFLDASPDRHAIAMFGHRHVVRMDEYTNLGRYQGFLSPSILERNPSYWTKFYIFGDGTVHYELVTASYP